jgi:iron complex outermembrane receptor protein
LNIAVYEINQRNILINANNPSEPDELVQRGADRSRGFEAELTGYILPQWHIYGGYSCIDAKILDDTNPDLIGKERKIHLNILSICGHAIIFPQSML